MDRVITKIRKSSSAELWVVLSDYTGSLRIDLREYFRSDDGTYKPTRKGVAVDRAEIADLLAGLEALMDAEKPGTVAVVARRTGSEIVAGVREYQGHVYSEVRQFVPDGAGGWRPTGKGVTFKAGMVPALSEAVEMAEALWGEMGGAAQSAAPGNEGGEGHAPGLASVVKLYIECPSCGGQRRLRGEDVCAACAQQAASKAPARE